MRALLVLALTASLGLNTTTFAAERVALVIGNGDYLHAPDALTAVRDSASVTKALKSAGWSVIQGTDLGQTGMRRSLKAFTRAMSGAKEIVIYYSGHALRTGGATYLAPVDTRAETLTDVMFDGVPLELVLRLASRRPGRSVVFLDGAQLSGFTPTKFAEPGLAALKPPRGVMIVSAAEPGKAIRRSSHRDSRFARLLIDQFLQPGAGVSDTAKRIGPPTHTRGSVDASFLLADPPRQIQSGAGLDAEIELAYWRTAERSGLADDYAIYLRRYPNGRFANTARQRLGLDRGNATLPSDLNLDPAAAEEQKLRLSKIRKRKIQEWLTALGRKPGTIDGILGRASRRAITQWQTASGFKGTGYLNEPQLERLSLDGKRAVAEQRRIALAEDSGYWAATGAMGTIGGYRAYLSRYPDGVRAKEARAALAKAGEAEDDQQVRQERRMFTHARTTDTAKAYRDYLSSYPNGAFRDEALTRLDEIEMAEHEAAEQRRLEQEEIALALSQADILSVEQRLRRVGFEPGALDGQIDERTRSAIKGYQASRGLLDTGFLDRPTVVNLVQETNERQQQTAAIDGAEVLRRLIEALNRKGTEQ